MAYAGQAGGFTYSVFGTFSHNKNKVLVLGTGSQQIIGGRPTLHGEGTTTIQVGGEVGAFYLVKTAGIFNTQNEVNNYKDKNGNLFQPNAKPGLAVLPAGDGQDQMMTEIRHQRMIEFAREGFRWYDLERWGLAKQELAATDKQGAQFYRSGKFDMFPVPQSELDNNPLMTQRAGW